MSKFDKLLDTVNAATPEQCKDWLLTLLEWAENDKWYLFADSLEDAIKQEDE